jgi:hypothetical protein
MIDHPSIDRSSKDRRRWGIMLFITLVFVVMCLATKLLSTPDAICQVHPLPTGEKVIQSTVEATPPPQASPGQSMVVSFSGGYVFLNLDIGCFDVKGEYVGGGYAHQDELAWSEVTQSARIRLSESDKQCVVEIDLSSERTAYAIVCGDGEVVGYVLKENLPKSAYTRTVSVFIDASPAVYLDDNPIATAECGNNCKVVFAVPTDTSPGRHKLEILLGSYYSWLEFELQVVE